MITFSFEKHGVDFCTPISNRFLLSYMPKASGSFVKVYLYMYTHFYHEDESLTPADAASELGLTQEDVMEALGYWQKEGLLSLVRNGEKCSINFRPCGSCPGPYDGTDPDAKSKKTAPKTIETTITAMHNPLPPTYSPEELSLYQKNASIAQLFAQADNFLGAPATPANLSLLYSFYDYYRLPLDVISYLMEYCAQKNNRNFRYMEKMVQVWQEKGVKTLEDAKRLVEAEDRCLPILALFGITTRKPNDKEKAFILSWLDEMQCSQDLIAEAARRTLSATGRPALAYADTILKNWLNSGITTAEAANHNDAEYGKTGTDYDAIVAQMQKKRFSKK